uniref:Uncharacterized protein n=1 Tax=Compsopogon caeruleus TaxID=31354 RepID=A0A7S1TDB4_9RHOD
MEMVDGVVPQRNRPRTPVFVYATAGLRLLGPEVAAAVMEATAAVLINDVPYLGKPDWVSIMDGQIEGVYAWVTANYLLGNVDGSKREPAYPNTTVGILDLGGGSLQVTFQAEGSGSFEDDDKAFRPLSVTKVGAKLTVYSRSFLGFGLKNFVQRLHHQVAEKDQILSNPCMNFGLQTKMTLGLADQMENVTTQGSGDFDRCVAHAMDIIEDSMSECESEKGSCALGRFQPPANGVFLAFAYFNDRVRGIGLSEDTTMDELAGKGREICALPEDQLMDKYRDVPNGRATEVCADLAYIYSLLTRGLNLNPDRVQLRFLQHIDGATLGWGIGALLDHMSDPELGSS